jgi:CelD/BcsL family acetyltransferase involved in cellulose biosynthesis
MIGGMSTAAASVDGQNGLFPCDVLDIAFSDLSAADIAGWRELELRALEPNIYLTYDYVALLSRHLIPETDIRVIVVAKAKVGGVDYRAVLPVMQKRGVARFPFPHYVGLHSIYSFLGGVLIDREHPLLAARQLFSHLRGRSWRVFGLRFVHLPLCTEQALIVQRAARLEGFRCWENHRQHRPWLRMARDGQPGLLGHLSRGRIKSTARRRRQLAELGTVHWRSVSGRDITQQHIDRFLDLEHQGWKGHEATSLRSNPEHQRFFVELVQSLQASDRVFFNELLVGDATVSSTVNFRLGDAAFAFKIGWDPDYAKYGVGTLNEISFLEALCGGGWSLTSVDSGAEEGSYLASLWPDREAVGTGIYASNPVANVFLFCARGCRNLARAVRLRAKPHDPR